ncbi:MAG: biopolymer transporter ExbD [Thalassolituus sp.]|jgi:biopolymer transport protein ExbD|uniref:TonB system transport protein ExbD2 n=2 Tax=root TaxID=1 RepID=M5E8I9_9GAMM|nr:MULTISPECIES: biopolymer transporter ExbD [Thalassolituus]PHQ88267.1 MAG: biopolymer transporter ExbD [Thalassobium sp.]APR68391.1 biopolymer transporter ExbD [Thalassolituus oleivorans]MBQ0726785.1 biopolymer transporter ExbD [Thalassolituus oleivorans]MBQ0781278.1 biopolymer transporter ExbD [Thalassolituus oleivorans]MDF1641153.1 biopolymer transporter ExbD [Thalassolituus oleivorans]|tara:strand:- start:166 stop:573 length:408 start_codon:yes stop_codon:yes gene_type:complete
MNNNLFLMNEDEENQIDLTPMLDVVFIMLIFFIVTSTFVKESGVDVTRPNAETSVVSESNSIQIGITAANQVFIDKREVDKRAVRANVEKSLAENPGAAVIIVADRDSNTSALIEVMDQARLAGATSVSVASENK